MNYRLNHLIDLIKPHGRVVIAFSGGVDSALVLKLAAEALGSDNVLAVLAVGDALSQSEKEAAIALAAQIGAELELVDPREIDNPGYRANAPNRCYFCKSELYDALARIAREKGYSVIFNGTNADDLGDHRPGLLAAEEFDVVSPLAQADLTKQDVRAMARELGLPVWDKPAQPCLASRIVYGVSVTPERLWQIERAEAFLRKQGFTQFRVRHHDQLARVEVPPTDLLRLVTDPLRSELIALLKELGFTYVSLDLQGFRSGSSNELLSISNISQT